MKIEPFPYTDLCDASLGVRSQAGADAGEEQKRREEALRSTAYQAGEEAARASFDRRLSEMRESVQQALSDFALERKRYFAQVEPEVVGLALAIARRILHREAQLDRLLLAGMVRVALEKINDGTKVTVRVNPQQVNQCRAYLAQHMEMTELPEVVEDTSLDEDRCILQTALGKSEAGPEVQLKEIEQGLADLIAKRPETA